ncbi:hypothetical protein D9753_03810 [Streptomyces dangxiongensis]|uniref:Rodlet layer protein n=1 Tax=Streptomyces dangxiongensis TaxID=1442032 RepID=A0A3G2JBT5_9ACTN|nr:hypothetical protein D9753_03810 [Streptomyces dangxiongensis]
MILKVLAVAAFAIAATTAVAVPASATDFGAGNGATDFGTRNSNTAVTGDAGGILNTYGAPLINIDGRCLVPLPEGEGIGGHGLGGPNTACNIAPVDQYQAPQKLL